MTFSHKSCAHLVQQFFLSRDEVVARTYSYTGFLSLNVVLFQFGQGKRVGYEVTQPNYQASFAFLPSPFFDNGILLWASEDDAKFSFGPLSELCDNGVIFGLCCRSHGLQDLVSWR